MLRPVPLIAFLVLSCITTAEASDNLAIDGIFARLFLGHSGSLSAALSGSEILRNTIIGEGDAEEPSSSMLIDVVVSGPPGEFDPRWHVDLVVTNSDTGNTIAQLSKDPGVLSKAGKYHVAFWLLDSGCEPIRVAATVRGTSQSKLIEVPFNCGD